MGSFSFLLCMSNNICKKTEGIKNLTIIENLLIFFLMICHILKYPAKLLICIFLIFQLLQFDSINLLKH